MLGFSSLSSTPLSTAGGITPTIIGIASIPIEVLSNVYTVVEQIDIPIEILATIHTVTEPTISPPPSSINIPIEISVIKTEPDGLKWVLSSRGKQWVMNTQTLKWVLNNKDNTWLLNETPTKWTFNPQTMKWTIK
jgi:hypothetical protein